VIVAMKIAATLNNPDGSPAIAGIQEQVAPLTPEEEESYVKIDFDPEAFRAEIGAPALRTATKADTLKRRWR
jgi:hypothetical protein